MFRAVVFLVTLALWPWALQAQGLARLVPEASGIEESRGEVHLRLALSQPVPFRVVATTSGDEGSGYSGLVLLDLNSVSWADLDIEGLETVRDLQTGQAPEDGWSRLVLQLAEPMGIAAAFMETDPESGQAVIELELTQIAARATAAGAPNGQTVPRTTPDLREARLVVVLDPGHGGIDPGAEADGVTEADLMLTFARELRDILSRSGRVDVYMTREEDVFVPLMRRVSLARSFGADAFISLHADALAEGRATGATIYTLSDTASDAAFSALAERHDRSDILTGVDLSEADDGVADVLMQMARREVAPESGALADALVAAIAQTPVALYRTPRREAGFTVLSAADIPSVLIEVGYLSEPEDLANIRDPAWRATFQSAIADALLDWGEARMLRRLLRMQ